MRIQKQDFLWIVPLCASIALLANIAIQEVFLNSAEIILPQAEASVSSAVISLAPVNVVPLSPVPEEEIVSQLPLELRGTIIGIKSSAFIFNTETGKGSLYKLDDLIEGYKIFVISAGRVLLENNGIIQELVLAGHRRKSDNEPAVYIDETGTTVVSRVHLLEQLPKVNELLAKLKILPTPAPDNNGLLGFRVENVPSGSIVDEVGIKNGDIIRSVEGKELKSVRDAWQAFNAVKNQSRFEVGLLRNDQPLILRYLIKN
jgi:general secretion pathway protein C